MELIFYLIIFILLGSAFFASLSFAPWVPCRSRDLKRIFEVAELKSGDIFYDLGCGNGKVVLYAGKHFDVKAIGVELAPVMYITCILRNIFHRNKRVKFKLGNLFKEDISKADVVYVWGMPDKLKKKFKDKIKKEAKSGMKLISYAFKIEGWEPIVVNKPSEKDVSIYLYKF